MRRESAMVAAALAHLPILLPGCHAWRNNTGTAQIGRRYVRFGELGSADIMCCWRGRLVVVECKSDKGRQSAAQRAWQQRIESAGGVYWLVRTTTDLETAAYALSLETA